MPKKRACKHTYQPCVYEASDIIYDSVDGYKSMLNTSIGTYCTTCGRIGVLQSDAWLNWSYRFSARRGDHKWTEEALIQLDKNTRALPTFHLYEPKSLFTYVLRDEFEKLHRKEV